MELSDLRIFRAVVEAGGVTHAARRLHRVQSNITARIQKLEADLQVELFLREGKRMQVSPAGRILLDYAEQLLALADRAREALHETTPRGLLRIGAMESTAAVRLPAPLSTYHARYPDVVIELLSGQPREMVADILAGELDAALVTEPLDDTRLEAVPVFTETLVLVTEAGHSPIRAPDDLRNRTLLAFHPGCPHRERLEAWFSRAGVPVERVIELSSYHAMLGCAVVGMGVALMPRSVLDSYAERDRLGVHPLAPPFHQARTLLVSRKGTPQAKITALAAVLLDGAAKPIRKKRKAA